MKYLIINHYATVPSFNGGTRHFDMAKELIKLGHEVTIIASSYNHFMKKETKKYKNNQKFLKENIDGVNFIWINTIGYKNTIFRIINMVDFYIKVKNSISNLNLKDIDIVIGSTVHFLAAQVALDIARKYDAKFIFEERDFWPQTFIDFGKISEKNIISKLLFKYESYFYRNADKIIVLFPKADKYVLSKNVPENKIIYLPNGYSESTDIDEVNNSELIKLYSGKTITYIGSHGIANDLDKILDLAFYCSDLDIKFIFIGDGLEKEKLIKRKKEENLNNVYFFDSINKNQVPYILKLTTFEIISIKNSPLYKYGFSMNKLYDYMNSARPIFMITTKEIGKDYLTDGITVSLDLQDHKNKMIEYLNNDSKYKEDCIKVREYGSKYSWSKLINYLDNNIN